MLKILIVDDEPNILLGLNKLIDWNSIGYSEPSLFTGPRDALNAIQGSDYDVLITDIRMPEMSGLELMEEAKKLRSNIKIIVLSSYSDYEYMHKALLEKAVNYLLKPVHEEELVETLKSLASKSTVGKVVKDGLNESYSKIYDSLKAVFDGALMDLKNDVYEINWDKMHSDLMSLDKNVRRICPFTPAKTLIIDNYNNLFSGLCKILKTTLLLKEDAITVDKIPDSCDSMTEITENAITLSDKLIDGCINKCTVKTGTIMDTVELYIQLNYDRPLTLNNVAKTFYFSPSYFSYTFSKGRDSFLSYLNKIRLRHGAALLAETEDTVSIIAGKVGYNSEKLFYKAFKNEYKCTPIQYRVDTRR